MTHIYMAENGYHVCIHCGTAKHKKPYMGFIYWFAGVGYYKEPNCLTKD